MSEEESARRKPAVENGGRYLRYYRRDQALRVDGAELSRRTNYSPDGFDGDLGDLCDLSLTAVRRELRRAEAHQADLRRPLLAAGFELGVHSTDSRDNEVVISLALEERELVVDIQAGVQPTSADEEETTPDEAALMDAIESLVRGFCDRNNLAFVEVFSYYYKHFPAFIHHARFAPNARGRSVGEAVSLALLIAEQVQMLIDCDQADKSFPEAALQAGRPDLLVGLYESSTLECKTQQYDLQRADHQIELAQDVARFANSEQGGSIVIGLKTKKDGTGDRIASLHPLTEVPKPTRYHKAIDRYVFPPVEGLEVRALPATPGGAPAILVIDVPAQPEELKPFLVTGAVIDGKVEGAFISIVRRRGEHSIPISAAAIHAWLAAGRALLRSPPAGSTE